MVRAEPGTAADLGDGVILEVLAPPEAGVIGGKDALNENSIVLRLVYGDLSFLLTGDLGSVGEKSLLNSGADIRSTVLKVGHHGSDGSARASSSMAPSVAVISVGENTFGHPSPSTRLQLAGLPLFRTDLNGRVVFKTDGRRLWIDTERGSATIASQALKAEDAA